MGHLGDVVKSVTDKKVLTGLGTGVSEDLLGTYESDTADVDRYLTLIKKFAVQQKKGAGRLAIVIMKKTTGFAR